MESHKVSFFSPFPFKQGQKINITSGPRKGDWLVIDVNERKVKLRCPVSLREFEWDRFCYFVEERNLTHWPKKD